jgi:hypothetical protein
VRDLLVCVVPRLTAKTPAVSLGVSRVARLSYEFGVLQIADGVAGDREAVTLMWRTGPSPSSGKRLSSDPIRKEPPISGVHGRAIGVVLGVIAAVEGAMDGSPAWRFAQLQRSSATVSVILPPKTPSRPALPSAQGYSRAGSRRSGWPSAHTARSCRERAPDVVQRGRASRYGRAPRHRAPMYQITVHAD